jgi:hypothetical protein
MAREEMSAYGFPNWIKIARSGPGGLKDGKSKRLLGFAFGWLRDNYPIIPDYSRMLKRTLSRGFSHCTTRSLSPGGRREVHFIKT